MPKDLNASVTDGLVAVDGIVSSTHPKAYVALVSSREDLPLVLHRATLAGESLLTVFVADSDDDLDAFASSGRVEIEEIEPRHKYLLKITPKSLDAKVRETCYLASPDDKEKSLRNFPIYAWIR